MNQLFLIISLLMAVVMLVVVGLLGRRKATLGSRAYLPLALSGGSFGAFFSEVLDVAQGGPHSLFGLILGFILAIAAGALFLWQRSKISREL